MADAKVSEAAKKAARLNVRPDLGAGYFTDERETWAMGYVAGAAAERKAHLAVIEQEIKFAWERNWHLAYKKAFVDALEHVSLLLDRQEQP